MVILTVFRTFVATIRKTQLGTFRLDRRECDRPQRRPMSSLFAISVGVAALGLAAVGKA